MMEGLLFSKLLALFGAGFLTSLSPCIYPMIPISLGYFGHQVEDGRKLNVILFFIGQVLTFTTLGVVAASLGEVFGFSSQDPKVQIGVGLLLILFGVASLFNFVPVFLKKANALRFERFKGRFFFPVMLGIGSALLASPCTTPVLGAVLATLSVSSHILMGILYMFFYALGATLIFLVVGLGMVTVGKLPKSGNWMKGVHRFSAILLSLAGLFFLYQGIVGGVVEW